MVFGRIQEVELNVGTKTQNRGGIVKDIHEQIKLDTHWAKRYYETQKKVLDDYEKDVDKERRIRRRECKTCHYLRNGVAGQALTSFECRLCKAGGTNPNTRVPKYCNKCSEKFDMCAKCGAEMD